MLFGGVSCSLHWPLFPAVEEEADEEAEAEEEEDEGKVQVRPVSIQLPIYCIERYSLYWNK